MTEAEWHACNDPGPMLRWLGDRATEEQLRRFGIGCCRRLWHLLTDERSRDAVVAAEGFIQGAVTPEELDAACDAAEWVYQDANLRAEDLGNPAPEPDRVAESAGYAAHMLAWPGFHAQFAADVAMAAAKAAAGRDLPNAESAAQAELLRLTVPYPSPPPGDSNMA